MSYYYFDNCPVEAILKIDALLTSETELEKRILVDTIVQWSTPPNVDSAVFILARYHFVPSQFPFLVQLDSRYSHLNEPKVLKVLKSLLELTSVQTLYDGAQVAYDMGGFR